MSDPAPVIRPLFATPVYEASLASERDFEALFGHLEDACLMLAEEDAAGRAWCKTKAYGGYTSYASLDDLPQRFSVFGELKRILDRHAAAFAEALAYDLGPRGKLKMDSLWVNVLKPGFGHSGHIHPHSVISGTVYVSTPPGASGLRLEDPRLPLQMAAPPRRKDASEDQQAFVTLTPARGTVFLWESWLRHEVPPNGAKSRRISISFNYSWK
ncbi:MAG: TIGR02466 family protein [Caulobacteraceae bacterium]